jgi:DNA-3-methyladenine glycosylase II
MTTAQETIARGERALARRDPVMRALIRQVGPAAISARRSRSYFEALAQSIVYQQLAGKAAAAIYGRFLTFFDGSPPSAQAVAQLSDERMRSAGLSNAKVASIRDLAMKSLDGTVPLRGLARFPDEEIIARLSSVRGIGRWTAEMFLIFQLARPDVWPVDDLGVRNGYRIAYDLPDMPKPKELAALGERFRPYRTVAAWYCWQAVHIARGDMVTPGRTEKAARA